MFREASCSEGNPAGSPLPETHSLFEADRRGRPETPDSPRCSNPSTVHNPEMELDKSLAEGQSCNRIGKKIPGGKTPPGLDQKRTGAIASG